MHDLSRRHALLSAAALAVPAWAAAQTAKTLHVVVPYPAGGLVDLQARIVAAPLGRALGQSAVVDNIAGAAGAIGLLRIATAAADAPEVGIGTDSDAVLAPLVNGELKYRSGQFRLLGLLSTAPMVLLAGPRVEAANLKQVLLAASQDRRQLSFGSYGVGSNAHLLAEDFARRSGIGLLHVPYKGLAPMMQDLLSGQIDMSFVPLAASVPDLVAGGKLRLLGVASAARHARFPAVPTVEETLGAKGFVHRSWSAVVVSPEMSGASVQKVHGALHAILQEPGVRSQFEAAGLELAAPMSLEEGQRFLDAEVERNKVLASLLTPTKGAAR